MYIITEWSMKQLIVETMYSLKVSVSFVDVLIRPHKSLTTKHLQRGLPFLETS